VNVDDLPDTWQLVSIPLTQFADPNAAFSAGLNLNFAQVPELRPAERGSLPVRENRAGAPGANRATSDELHQAGWQPSSFTGRAMDVLPAFGLPPSSSTPHGTCNHPEPPSFASSGRF
jgi:hypothetical protein